MPDSVPSGDGSETPLKWRYLLLLSAISLAAAPIAWVPTRKPSVTMAASGFSTIVLMYVAPPRWFR